MLEQRALELIDPSVEKRLKHGEMVQKKLEALAEDLDRRAAVLEHIEQRALELIDPAVEKRLKHGEMVQKKLEALAQDLDRRAAVLEHKALSRALTEYDLIDDHVLEAHVVHHRVHEENNSLHVNSLLEEKDRLLQNVTAENHQLRIENIQLRHDKEKLQEQIGEIEARAASLVSAMLQEQARNLKEESSIFAEESHQDANDHQKKNLGAASGHVTLPESCLPSAVVVSPSRSVAGRPYLTPTVPSPMAQGQGNVQQNDLQYLSGLVLVDTHMLSPRSTLQSPRRTIASASVGSSRSGRGRIQVASAGSSITGFGFGPCSPGGAIDLNSGLSSPASYQLNVTAPARNVLTSEAI